MISVVMATYNGEKYLREQLDSILAQSKKVDEIIVVDDCSSDGTVRILNEYKCKHKSLFRIYINKINDGYIKTFYSAIDKSEGDFIFLSDQDDIWNPDKVKKMIEVIELKSYDVLVSNYSLIDKNGNRIYEHFGLRNNVRLKNISNINIKSVINYNLSMGCTMVMTKKFKNILSKNINFLRDLKLPHDWAINIIASNKGTLGYFNKKLIFYRLHDKNTIGLKRANNIKNRINDYRNIIVQKQEMIVIIRNIENSTSENIHFINDEIISYQERINYLENKNLINYCRMVIQTHLLKYANIKTILLDLYLIIRDKKNE